MEQETATSATLSTGVAALQNDIANLDRITSRIGWITHKQQTQRLKAFNLTVPQYMILRALRRLDVGCSMSELAEAAMQVAATVTGIIDRLEERHLVSRQPNPTDRRSTQIFLTTSGQQLLADIDQVRRQQIETFMQGLEPETRQQLLSLLQHYLEALLLEQ